MNDMAYSAELAAAPAAAARRRRRPFGWLLLGFVAFLLGCAATLWLVTRWDRAPELLGIAPPPPVRLVAPVTTVPVITAGPPAIDGRVAALEARLAAIDGRARAAAGNAGRAEGLLIAFAARRALDRGVALGYLEGLLSERFGAAQPQAVATILTAARRPVTLDALKLRLGELAPDLAGQGSDGGWWQAFRREATELVTVRRAGAPSNLPADRVQLALARLDAGQADAALAEVSRLPARHLAADWIADARRYVAARRALDLIETAALLDAPGPAPASMAVAVATPPVAAAGAAPTR